MEIPIFDRCAPLRASNNFEEHFNRPEDYEPQERESKSEDFGALYFDRINRIPPLTKAEARDLLERWCRFKDEGAKERIASAHLRMVPRIAREIARKFAFEPFWDSLTASAKRDAVTGFHEVVSDLTAEGNLALVNALEHYRLDEGVVFYTYARTCVRNAVARRARALRSVVERPFGKPTPWDMSIDPGSPTHTTRETMLALAQGAASATRRTTLRTLRRNSIDCDHRLKNRK